MKHNLQKIICFFVSLILTLFVYHPLSISAEEELPINSETFAEQNGKPAETNDNTNNFYVYRVQGEYDNWLVDGESFTLIAGVRGNDITGVTYQWYKNVFNPDINDTVYSVINGATGPSLTVQNQSMTVEYVCEAKDRYSNYASTTFRIIIDNSFEATAVDPVVRIYPEERAILEVKTKAKDKSYFYYQWAEITQNGAEFFDGGLLSTIRIGGLTKEKSYLCRVTDKYGTMTDVVFHIVILQDWEVTFKKTSDLFIDPLSVAYPEINCRIDRSKLIWESSDPSIVSVDQNGRIQGKNPGRAQIKVKDPDNWMAFDVLNVQVHFKDVRNDSKYYYDPVYWAAKANITKGYDNGDFKPRNKCTREAIVTFLWRSAGKPSPKSMASPFKDVQDKSKYYYKAVLWAAEQGITNGYSDGTFRPNATCLREHVVTFLWRYSGKPKVNTANHFNDVSSKDYYYMPVLWAANRNITKGYADDNYTTFRPKDDCLREHVVTFLYRRSKNAPGIIGVES